MVFRGGRLHYPEDRLLYGLAVVLAIALTIGWLIGFGALLATLTHRLL
jgi:hypothetical protein